MGFAHTLSAFAFRAALTALALSGPLAQAQVSVEPRVGDVDSGGGIKFTVSRPGQQPVFGTWDIVEKDADHQWRPVADRSAGRISVRLDCGLNYLPPEVERLTLVYLRFRPQDAVEAPLIVQVRVWPPRVRAGADLADSDGFSDLEPRRESAPMTAQGLAAPESAPRARRISESPFHYKAAMNSEAIFPGPEGEADAPAQVPAEPTQHQAATQTAAPSPSPALQTFLEGPKVQLPSHRRILSDMTGAESITFLDSLTSTLGKGTFASVEEVEIGKQHGVEWAAAKIFHRSKYDGNTEGASKRRKLLRRELQALKAMKHPNIIRFFGFHEDEARYAIIMELGLKTLEHIRRENPGTLPEPIIKKYTWEILNALKHMHDNNLVHGDLKGKNILLSKYGTMKVADLGNTMSCAAGAITCASNFTILWAAPEMVMAGPGYTTKADIWALGCVVVEMLTGEDPWHEMRFKQFKQAADHISTEGAFPAIPANTSPELRGLLERCLVRDPDLRADAQALLADPYFAGLASATSSGLPGTCSDSSPDATNSTAIDTSLSPL